MIYSSFNVLNYNPSSLRGALHSIINYHQVSKITSNMFEVKQPFITAIIQDVMSNRKALSSTYNISVHFSLTKIIFLDLQAQYFIKFSIYQ